VGGKPSFSGKCEDEVQLGIEEWEEAGGKEGV
jgi:hypothetical protein